MTIKKITNHFGISRSFLFKQFKLYNEFTLQEFINRQRIFHAAFLLFIDDKELTIEKISHIVGYCNSEYFIRVFKKYFGITPGRYRSLFRTKKVPNTLKSYCPQGYLIFNGLRRRELNTM